MGGRGAKIEDVARAAGVSIMSVSRAMRGVEGLSPETRSRILRTADKLDYVPNRAAGSLATAASNLIGISVPTLFDSVFAEILDEMRGPLLRSGYELMIETSDYSRQREEAWIERIIKWSPAALVVCGTDHSRKSRERLAASGIPTLEIWDTTDDPIDLSVGIDHDAAGYAMGRHLVSLGYCRPAYIGTTKGRDPRAEKRVQGLARAFEGAGLGLVADMRIDGPSSFDAGRQGCARVLNDLAEWPDVLCFLTDHLAFGGLMECAARGLEVPEAIGIVGFNDLGINDVLPQKLTTSRTPRAQIGETSARMLIAAMSGIRKARTVALPVEIVHGKSTRKVK